MTADQASKLVSDGAQIVAAAITAARAIVDDQGIDADPWEIAQEILSVATEQPQDAVSAVWNAAPPNGTR